MSGGALLEKSPYIVFADPAMKALCVGLWGGADGGTAAANTRVNNVKVTGVDGELTYEQAASIKSIATDQFRNNTTITSFDELQYFTGLTTIKSNVFSGCSSLVSIAIPSNLTSIETNAFNGCSGLAAVHISDLEAWCNISYSSSGSNPLNSGSHHLYLNGEEIKDLVIPNTVTTIKSYTFAGGSSFTSLTLHNSVTSIGQSAFSRCTSLTSVTIPNGVTSIGGWAFYSCSSLTSITIPNSVTSTGAYSFRQCTSLSSITIPNSITSIDSYSFSRCTSLTSITIPNSVTNIGNQAFSEDKNIASITVLATTPPTLGSSAFGGTSASLVIYVPAESVEAYKTASNWSAYADKIQAIPTA